MPIEATLPWGNASQQGGLLTALQGTPQQAFTNLANLYSQGHAGTLGFQEQNYNNTIGGYGQVMDQQRTADEAIGGGYTDQFNRLAKTQEGIVGGYGEALKGLQTGGYNLNQGYGNLQNQVLGDINGIGQSRARDLADSYTAQSGRLSNDLYSRGLANTTVMPALQQGLTFQHERAQSDLAEQIAGMRAGYRSNLGLAGLSDARQQLMTENAQRNTGLNYEGNAALQLANQGNTGLNFQERAAGANTGLGLNQLNFMERVNAPYPDAGMYTNLAQMYGAQQGAGTNAANDARLLAMGTRELRNNSGINPAMMQMPGFARSAGGGPPASAMMQTGTSGGGLMGAGGGLFGSPVGGMARPPSQLVGTGAGAFGGTSGGTGYEELAAYGPGGGDFGYGTSGGTGLEEFGGYGAGFGAGDLGYGGGLSDPGFYDQGWGGGFGQFATDWANNNDLFDMTGY